LARIALKPCSALTMKLALALLVAAASAFAPAPVAPRATRLRAETADYASMDVDALEKIIEESRRKLLDLRLEKRQQSKKAQFKSSEVRALKATVARVMPFYEAKLDGVSGAPVDQKRSMAKERRAKKETVEA
tara:strand:+ start:34 stop:432 length:399 start_codon:yes stop_codon:yes gene_type:complete